MTNKMLMDIKLPKGMDQDETYRNNRSRSNTGSERMQ